MKKNTTYLVALMVAIISFFVFSQSKAVAPKFNQNKESDEASNSMGAQKENVIENYTIYTENDFELTKNQRRVLYFYANWCSTCRPANVEFMEKGNLIPEDVVVFRINYNDSDTDDTEKDLAKKYQITYQHTFVQVDSEGKVLTRWNGGEIDDLLNRIK